MGADLSPHTCQRKQAKTAMENRFASKVGKHSRIDADTELEMYKDLKHQQI